MVDAIVRMRSADRAARLHAASRLPLLVGVLLRGSACATPIGAVRVDTQEAHRALTRSVPSTGALSALTDQTVRRLGLAERFEQEPEAVLAQLRGSGVGLSRERLFALAELSFLYAEREPRQDHYLAAAIYAYAFMLESVGARAIALDPRTRLAADLYNPGLTRGLATPRQ